MGRAPQRLSDLRDAPVVAYKTADQTVTESTVLVDDTDLVLSVAAGATYTMSGLFIVSAHSNGDIKFGWTFPAGLTLRWFPLGADVGAAGHLASVKWGVYDQTQTPPVSTYGDPASYLANALAVKVTGIVNVGATAGTLQLRWAMNTVVASTCTMKADSWLRLERLA